MPLNESLYALLRANFGEVRIANPGAQAHVTYSNGKLARVTDGEYYRVCCPDCDDRDFKLWISYTFGSRDTVTGTEFSHTAICYRCGAADLADLHERLFPVFGRRAAVAVPVAIGAASQDTLPPRLSPPAGTYMRLGDLTARHPARAYMEARGFDVVHLDTLGWQYCSDSAEKMVARRIVIPLLYEYADGIHAAGCQSRAIPDLSVAPSPKYWTMTGTKKSRIVYNLAVARHAPALVVTEGVMDAARVGACGVSLFGKTASSTQIGLLRRYCAGKDVVVMLDNDAQKDADQLVADLRVSSVFANNAFKRVVNVVLPTGDPATYTREALHARIVQALEQ